MSLEENKALVRRFQEETWKGNISVIDELAAPGTLLGGVDAEQWKAEVLETLRLNPDLVFTIEDMIAEGDKVVTRWKMTSTHTKTLPTPFGESKPTGKLVTLTGISIERIENGKLVEDRFENSGFDYFTQLGVLPTPGSNS